MSHSGSDALKDFQWTIVDHVLWVEQALLALLARSELPANAIENLCLEQALWKQARVNFRGLKSGMKPIVPVILLSLEMDVAREKFPGQESQDLGGNRWWEPNYVPESSVPPTDTQSDQIACPGPVGVGFVHHPPHAPAAVPSHRNAPPSIPVEPLKATTPPSPFAPPPTAKPSPSPVSKDPPLPTKLSPKPTPGPLTKSTGKGKERVPEVDIDEQVDELEGVCDDEGDDEDEEDGEFIEGEPTSAHSVDEEEEEEEEEEDRADEPNTKAPPRKCKHTDSTAAAADCPLPSTSADHPEGQLANDHKYNANKDTSSFPFANLWCVARKDKPEKAEKMTKKDAGEMACHWCHRRKQKCEFPGLPNTCPQLIVNPTLPKATEPDVYFPSDNSSPVPEPKRKHSKTLIVIDSENKQEEVHVEKANVGDTVSARHSHHQASTAVAPQAGPSRNRSAAPAKQEKKSAQIQVIPLDDEGKGTVKGLELGHLSVFSQYLPQSLSESLAVFSNM
ncbi:hypothetical protein JAAARDRAFT_200862 [Jaapia argillacea MUCL 33604]|uniref:Uncharacterized protein n=1 Tax=Jaapia argillacea MUCL 33604 TaxID=933084 RepID=A0A067P6L2_9AGAM|nr:hypothetical protein JAAARDRAFT_200862 [Jaapia argillacea MUCL 33604]